MKKSQRHYDHGCKIFLSFFMSILTAQNVRNSHTLAGKYFVFLKKVLNKTSLSIPNLDLTEKIEESK